MPATSCSLVHSICRLLVWAFGSCLWLLHLSSLAAPPPASPFSPTPIEPHPGAILFGPHPHFSWSREPDLQLGEFHRIQIARDATFQEIVCDDLLQVVSRFVPVSPLPPLRYWWRVRRGEGSWSESISFELRQPAHSFHIPAGSSAQTIARILQEAAANPPAEVHFEPGSYPLSSDAGKPLVTLSNPKDLILNGHGAHLILDGPFLSLIDAQRVTLQHFRVTPARPGHTLVRITKKDPKTASVWARAEPGFDPDVSRFFDMQNSGGSFLGCIDPSLPGKYLRGAGLSARNTRVELHPSEPGCLVFSPVPAATLEAIPEGSLAVVTSYHWQWVKLSRGERVTFSHVTVSDLPGAFSGGASSAKSYLGCKVECAPGDFFGGHAATGSGRIGEWIEGCTFECLPDDGPAQQSFRIPIQATEGDDIVLVGGNALNGPVRVGDHLALVHPKTRLGVHATAVSVTPQPKHLQIQLDRPLLALAKELSPREPLDWTRVALYCNAQSNEDFVYRHNRISGGRAHGVKFNGTRAWIADNAFEHLNGNAVLAGYSSEVSGHGAREVVVSGNHIVHCGWSPIDVQSTSRLGGRILIRGNTIHETRDAAISIRGCTEVRIEHNHITSSTLPTFGAWIYAEHSSDLRLEANQTPPEVPLLKTLPAVSK